MKKLYAFAICMALFAPAAHSLGVSRQEYREVISEEWLQEITLK